MRRRDVSRLAFAASLSPLLPKLLPAQTPGDQYQNLPTSVKAPINKPLPSQMADRGAGPRAIAKREIEAADLFVFPSPDRPGHLVMIMDVHPFKEIEATRLLFSDAVDYRIRLRPLRIAAAGQGTAFVVGEQECFFSFTF